MRLKFVFALLVVAVLVLAAAFLLKQHLGGESPAPANPAAAAPVVPVESSAVATVAPPPEPAPAPIAPAPTNILKPLTPEQQQAAIDAEIDRLDEWSMKKDPASLSNILADLTHPEKEVREAAIEAARQFRSSDAIPALKAAAAGAQDTEEQIELLEAADFLSLPPLVSGTPPPMTREQKKAQAQQAKEMKKAGKQTRPQGASGRNSTTGANQ